MKTKTSIIVCCLLAVLSITQASVFAGGLDVVDTESLIDSIITVKLRESNADDIQSWLDDELSSNAGVLSEWYVMALRQYDPTLDFTVYADSLEKYLKENKVSNAATRQRCALTLIACERDNSSFVLSTLDDSIGKQGIMSWIFGLHMLNNGVKSNEYTADEIIDTLISLEKKSGGWALTGENGDIDVSSMTIQALAPYYSSNLEVKKSVDKAIDFLSEKQLEDGAYQSFGTKNPESAAQVITALSSLGIDPRNDERFIKNGNTLIDGMMKFRLEDGTFSHTEGGESNYTAMTQVFCSLVALSRLKSSSGMLYVFDEALPAETVTEPEPSTEPLAEPFIEAKTEPESEITETSAATTAVEQSLNEEATVKQKKANYKVLVSAAVVCVILTISLVLWLRGKRNVKNYIFVTVIGVVIIGAVCITDFQTADEYYGASRLANKSNPIGNVIMTIRCDTVVGKSDSEFIPSDGVILPLTEFVIEKNDTVFTVLTEAARRFNIQMENEGAVSGSYGLAYIMGINYLYEFDFGDLSGWVYRVNGIKPSVGCSEYTLSDGDYIEWLYTCELGEDIN